MIDVSPGPDQVRHVKRMVRLDWQLVETVFLFVFLAASAVWRIILLRIETINPDEIFLIGGAYRVHGGKLPFLDYLEVHAPFIYRVYAPLVGWIGETSRYVDGFRWLHWLVSLVLLLFLFLLVRRLYGARTALWSVFLVNTFSFFIQRSVHVRWDTPALLLFVASLYGLTYRKDPSPDLKRLALAAFGMALAFSFHLTIAFSVVAVFVWLFWQRTGSRFDLRSWKVPLVFGSSFVVSYFVLNFLMFGTRTPVALFCHARSFAFDGLYLNAFERDTTRIFVSIVCSSLLSWIFLAWAVGLFNVRWLTRRMRNPHTGLFVFLTDMGILFLLVRNNKFEQHYFPLVIFGSILVALLLQEWEKKARISFGKKGEGLVGLTAALLLTISSSAAWIQTYRAVREKDTTEERLTRESLRDLVGTLDFEEAGAVRDWLNERPWLFEPFRYRPKHEREAQIRFILAHSRSGQTVFSDWLNPPYRELPVSVQHGFMISAYYRSQRLREDPELILFLKRYDPSFSTEDVSEADHTMRLFNNHPPQLVLLEGNIARLFCVSDRFRDWTTERYEFVMERESGSVFAVHKHAAMGEAEPNSPLFVSKLIFRYK